MLLNFYKKMQSVFYIKKEKQLLLISCEEQELFKGFKKSFDVVN